MRSVENADAQGEVGVLDGGGHEAQLHQGDVLQRARHLQLPGVHRAQSQALDECRYACLCLLVVAGDEHVQWATLGQQHTIEAPLADLARRGQDAGISAPALTIVGPVVAFREEVSWFEKLPLFGRRVLVTRPAQQSADLVRKLEELGAIVHALPAVQVLREAAGNQQTVNNLKQMGLAIHFANDTHRKLPPAYDKFANSPVAASVHVHLMPFVNQNNAYKAYMENQGKGEVATVKIKEFLAPDDPSVKDKTVGIQNFAANLRVFATTGNKTKYDADMPELKATEPGNAAIPRTFTDGTSNTIVFATKYGICGDGGSKYAAEPNSKFAAFFGQNAAKMKAHPSDTTATYQLSPGPKECACSPLMAQSFSKKGLIVALADGSVRTLSPGLSAQTWNCALQPNDGMVLGKDWED